MVVPKLSVEPDTAQEATTVALTFRLFVTEVAPPAIVLASSAAAAAIPWSFFVMFMSSAFSSVLQRRRATRHRRTSLRAAAHVNHQFVDLVALVEIAVGVAVAGHLLVIELELV